MYYYCYSPNRFREPFNSSLYTIPVAKISKIIIDTYHCKSNNSKVSHWLDRKLALPMPKGKIS